ncbi:MAG: DUF4160 domain-containing protein [Chloroflexi bacterium]|nr:DUF4160 domain-containing protein [Chloroflexota bacterium]MCC6892301.1 DUF4160 domain-containing protein [Anaerolineae bacterium]
MPTVIREDGYTIRIYLNDHIPAHVHVLKAEKEARITLVDLKVMDSIEFTSKELKRAIEIIEEHQDELLKIWDTYHEER